MRPGKYMSVYQSLSTSALALLICAAAAAQIPLTHRRHASTVVLATGHPGPARSTGDRLTLGSPFGFRPRERDGGRECKRSHTLNSCGSSFRSIALRAT